MAAKWDDVVKRWLPLIKEMERLGFEDYAEPEILRSAIAHIKHLEATNTAGLGIKVSDGDVWLIFPNAAISIEGLCKFGGRGPIVKKNLRAWRDAVLVTKDES